MYKFLRRLLVFILLTCSAIFTLIYLTDSITKKYASFKIDKNVKYIVVGHSHPECAFNDSLIANFKNLGNSGESYFYTYFKLKQLIKQNSNIETVFIEFTNNQIDKSMNEWVWDNKYLSYRFPLYSPYMNCMDKYTIMKNNFSGFQNAMSLSLKNKIGRLFSNDFNFSNEIGGYLYLERDKTDSLIQNMPIDSVKNNSVTDISETNLQYLSKIVELCKENKKKIILIRSPQHKMYKGYHNETIYKSILNSRFSNVEYLDFSKFPLLNSEFGDLEHLNHKGATRFSIWFNQLLKNGILVKSEKQKFIDHEMSK